MCLKAAGHSGRVVRKFQNLDLVVILLTFVLPSFCNKIMGHCNPAGIT